MSAARAAGRITLLLLRLVTAGLFIWAAAVKLAGPRDFLFSIKGFNERPETIVIAAVRRVDHHVHIFGS